MYDQRNTFHKSGKLLLSSEYFVLDGTPALAVPTKFGQKLTTKHTHGTGLVWEAYDQNEALWFSANIPSPGMDNNREPQPGEPDFTTRLREILLAADELNPGAYNKATLGQKVTTHLEFDRNWGLGSSSTLIAAVAQWLEVNPYELLERTFGGSGYDLACAIAKGPIIYERNGITPKVIPLNWHPEWVKNTHFVYRNQKQNSREGIRAYREKVIPDGLREQIGKLTLALTEPSLHLRAAAQILHRHEQLVSETLGMPTVQEELFSDFPGQLKSLGAWGGDFIWAVSEENDDKVREYFNGRGFGVVIGYEEMVL